MSVQVALLLKVGGHQLETCQEQLPFPSTVRAPRPWELPEKASQTAGDPAGYVEGGWGLAALEGWPRGRRQSPA